MGGTGTIIVEEEPAPTEEPTTDGGIPDTVEGPLNDMMDGDGVPVLSETATEFTCTIDDTVYTCLVSFQLFDKVDNVSTPDAVVGGEPDNF